MQNPGDRIAKSTDMGPGNSKFSSAVPNGSMRASSTSATGLQQAEAMPAADGPSIYPDKMLWPRISVHGVSLTGTHEEVDLLAITNLTSDEGDIAKLRQLRNAVPAPYSILPLEQLTGIFKSKHKVSEEDSSKFLCHENDTRGEKHHEKGMEIAAHPVNGSKDSFLQKEVSKTLSVMPPEATPSPLSVHKEPSGEGCAPMEGSRSAEAAQGLQVESQGPNLGPCDLPTTFSDLFQSVVASGIPLPQTNEGEYPALPSGSLLSQVMEMSSLPNGLSATSSTVPRVDRQDIMHVANTTTRLILDGLTQPLSRLQPPALLQVEKALEPVSSKRSKANMAITPLGDRPAFRPLQSSGNREAQLASVATTVSAAASVAKSAVEAAEASIGALTQLGMNKGNLYHTSCEGGVRFANPRPLQVACGSRPVAAGVKRKFQDQGPQIVEQIGGRSMPHTLDLIKTGSTVEVMPEEEGLQGGWFFAKVFSMTPKEALVVYNDLMADDGCSYLEESFPLHCSREEDTFGSTVSGARGWIRPVHPFSSAQKRGHFSMVPEAWAVGDHVDAFVKDGWWEGIIDDLNEEDETRITVYFPGDGSTMVVKAWNVRPSLIWTKGEWRAWRGNSLEQDCPSKRQKTSACKDKVEREQTRTKGKPAERTPEPLAITPARQSGADKKDKGVLMYTRKGRRGQSSASTEKALVPVRELRSGTRSSASPAQTKALSIMPASKGSAPTSKGSSPLARSQQQIEAVMTPEPWDVKRLSTRLQQKDASQSPQDAVRGKAASIKAQQEGAPETPEDNVRSGKTPSSRSSKKETPEAPQDTVKGKTPSRRSHQKEVSTVPTRCSQRLAARKVCISNL